MPKRTCEVCNWPICPYCWACSNSNCDRTIGCFTALGYYFDILWEEAQKFSDTTEALQFLEEFPELVLDMDKRIQDKFLCAT